MNKIQHQIMTHEGVATYEYMTTRG